MCSRCRRAARWTASFCASASASSKGRSASAPRRASPTTRRESPAGARHCWTRSAPTSSPRRSPTSARRKRWWWSSNTSRCCATTAAASRCAFPWWSDRATSRRGRCSSLTRAASRRRSCGPEARTAAPTRCRSASRSTPACRLRRWRAPIIPCTWRRLRPGAATSRSPADRCRRTAISSWPGRRARTMRPRRPGSPKRRTGATTACSWCCRRPPPRRRACRVKWCSCWIPPARWPVPRSARRARRCALR